MLFRKKQSPKLSIESDGFSAGDVLVAWPAVNSIKAYKLDLITSDMICFEIEIGDVPLYLQITEEWIGFNEFAAALEVRFKFPEGWWEAVTFPPMKTNEFKLFQRD